MRSSCLIYGLIDPRTDEIRYVGQTSHGMKRPQGHVYFAKKGGKTHRDAWIRQLIDQGLTYEIKVLEQPNWDQLNIAEIWWIKSLRETGHRLTNHTNGGEGTRGWRHSEISRQKIRAALEGHDVTDAARQKMREAKVGRRLTEEHKVKIGRNNKGRVVSQETKDKIKQKILGRKHTAASKMQMSITKRSLYRRNVCSKCERGHRSVAYCRSRGHKI